MKLLVSLNKEKIDKYLNYTNSFIIGISNLSVNYNEYTLEEVKNLLDKYPNIEIFIALNKNMFNKDLINLENTMNELNKLNIKAVLFYDIAVLSIYKKNKYKYDLVYNQDYQVTNYNMINYYYNEGCKYSILASEITIDEIKEIKNNTKSNLIGLIFGYPVMSVSKRKFITNYNKYNNTNYKNEIEITDKESKYLVKETINTSTITNLKILNSIESINKLKDILEYGIIRLEYINSDEEILKALSNYIENKITKEECEKIIYNITGEEYDNFFNKKTIYKVK